MPIRVPATANLMIDSADKTGVAQNCWDFRLIKKENLLTGFFNRIGVTEMVLEWYEPNISALLGNRTIQFDVSGAPGNPYTITLPPGLYNIAEALDLLEQQMNVAPGVGGLTDWAIQPVYGGAQLSNGGGVEFNVLDSASPLNLQLGFVTDGTLTATKTAVFTNANLSPIRYIDFVSTDLTYNQDLKDTSSAENSIGDVLARFYFAWDTPVNTDTYGFPILMGYEPFVVRRLFNPPKQIKWDKVQPIGQINFSSYGRQSQNLGGDYKPMNQIIPTTEANTQWLMTLQVSEN